MLVQLLYAQELPLRTPVIFGSRRPILGMFVCFAADASRFQLRVTDALKGRTVLDNMTRSPIIVPPDITVANLIDNWVYKHSFEFFPVVDAGRLIGSVSLQEVKQGPHSQRERTRVGDIIASLVAGEYNRSWRERCRGAGQNAGKRKQLATGHLR